MDYADIGRRDLRAAVEVSLSYDGAFKEHYQDHTGLLNVKLEF